MFTNMITELERIAKKSEIEEIDGRAVVETVLELIADASKAHLCDALITDISRTGKYSKGESYLYPFAEIDRAERRRVGAYKLSN